MATQPPPSTPTPAVPAADRATTAPVANPVVDTNIFVYCNNAAVMLPIGEGLVWSNDTRFEQSDDAVPGCILFYWRSAAAAAPSSSPFTPPSRPSLVYEPAAAYPMLTPADLTTGLLVMDCTDVPNVARTVAVPDTPADTWYALNASSAVAVVESPDQPPTTTAVAARSGYYATYSQTVAVTGGDLPGYYYLQVSCNWIKCNDQTYEYTSNRFADSCGSMIRLEVEPVGGTADVYPAVWNQYLPRIFSTVAAAFVMRVTRPPITAVTVRVSLWFTAPAAEPAGSAAARHVLRTPTRALMTAAAAAGRSSGGLRRSPSAVDVTRALRARRLGTAAAVAAVAATPAAGASGGVGPTMYTDAAGNPVPPYGNCIYFYPDLQGYTSSGIVVNLYKWPVL